MELKGRVALVTGSATGVGRAVAIRFAKRGFAVALNYSRSAAEAEATLADVEALDVPAILCRATRSSASSPPARG